MKTGDMFMGYPVVVTDEVPTGFDGSTPVAVFGLFHDWRPGATGGFRCYRCAECGIVLLSDDQRNEACPGPKR